jgi:hypothetical protein
LIKDLEEIIILAMLLQSYMAQILIKVNGESRIGLLGVLWGETIKQQIL